MFRPTLLLSIATACLAAGPCALAQDAVSPTTSAAAHTNAQAHGASHPDEHDCLRSTGSLIPPKPGECLPVAGHSYSREDIRRTGAVNTADALRLLDPGVVVHGH